MSPKTRRIYNNVKAKAGTLSVFVLLLIVAISAVLVWNPSMDIGVRGATVDQFSSYKEITLDHTQVPSTLTNFPVLINLSSDADLAADALNNGNDIAFFNATDVQLNHEIELFNGTTGQLVAWVNITSLAHDADTTIKMYYGDADIGASAENVAGTWDSDFLLVYHCNDNDGGLTDSTSNNNDATEGTNAPDADDYEVASIAGYCVSPDGQGNDGDSEGWNISTGIMTHADWEAGYTISCWSSLATRDQGNYYIASFNANSAISVRYDEFDTTKDEIEVVVANTAGTTYLEDATDVTVGTWDFSVHRYNGSDIFLNVDDHSEKTDSSADLNDNDGTNDFCKNLNDYWGMDGGKVDELRISGISRSDDWIKTEYNSINNATQGDANCFFSLGSESGASSASIDFGANPSDYFTTSGIVDGSYYANNTGTYYETANLTVTISGSNIEFIRVNVSDIDTNITANYINISFDDDNSSWSGNWYSCTSGGETITVNGSNWDSNNWMSGTNPFTADGDGDGYDEIQSTTSVYWRVCVTYPSGIGNETYSNLAMTYDGGVYS